LPEVLPSSLARVLSESVPRLWAPVWAALRAGGWQIPVVTAAALSAAAAGTVLEALLFRGLFDMGRHLGSTAARLSAVGAVLSFLAVLLMLDWPASASLLRLGRMLELRLRLRFLVKIPRLSDRYFQSRLLSDMALRAHSLRLLRQLPGNVGHCLQLLASVIVTAVAIAWIYPGTALLVGLSVAAACVVPVLFLPLVTERDLRYRELGATLTSLQLDCLLGARAIQAHSAQHTLRAVQDELLRRWRVAGLKRQAMYVQAETAMMALGFALVVVLVYRQAAIVASPAGLLLLIYWASSIPLLGQDIATAARTLPAIRNTLLRFLEPLGSPEEDTGPVSAPASTGGVKITLNDVSVILAGHAVLERITLTVQPGEHVGIVGASGAGKSSLVGCLLGWYPPASGTICVDDAPLDSRRLAQLRRETVWIDPQVHLFHKTLFENLRYGNDCDSGSQIAEAVDTAGLAQTLRYLADGLQTDIGEAGMRLSGGEGQRVRAVRGLGRSGVRLAVLDEPARGLGRDHRRRLLASARRRLAGATLLCITHDLADTLDFDRVVVIEQRRIREQGKPRDLCATTASRFRELLEQEAAVGRELWAHPMWRRVKLHAGALRESKAPRM
jgi:ATP-binding cassette subfamily B protein